VCDDDRKRQQNGNETAIRTFRRQACQGSSPGFTVLHL
ncbi:hypothetical protein AVDCRST_MAG94-3063, partial [uncultured Leptolyngbya sp.]